MSSNTCSMTTIHSKYNAICADIYTIENHCKIPLNCILITSGFLEPREWQAMNLTCRTFHILLQKEAFQKELRQAQQKLSPRLAYISRFPFIRIFGSIRQFQQSVPEVVLPRADAPNNRLFDHIDEASTNLLHEAHVQMKRQKCSIARAQIDSNRFIVCLRLKDRTPDNLFSDTFFEAWVFDGRPNARPSRWQMHPLRWSNRYESRSILKLSPNHADYLNRLIHNKNCGHMQESGLERNPRTTLVEGKNISTVSLLVETSLCEKAYTTFNVGISALKNLVNGCFLGSQNQYQPIPQQE